MAISETKMQIVIANYFKDECDVNTSIKQAFEKGFRIGVKKGANTNRPQGEWIAYTGMQPPELHGKHYCSNCHHALHLALNGGVYDFCPSCGYQMIKRT